MKRVTSQSSNSTAHTVWMWCVRIVMDSSLALLPSETAAKP